MRQPHRVVVRVGRQPTANLVATVRRKERCLYAAAGRWCRRCCAGVAGPGWRGEVVVGAFQVTVEPARLADRPMRSLATCTGLTHRRPRPPLRAAGDAMRVYRVPPAGWRAEDLRRSVGQAKAA